MILEIILIVLVCLIGLFLITVLFLISPKRVKRNNPFNVKKIKFAHRGFHNLDKSIPENSMEAFKKAIDLGYGIELDIRETKDKEIVVFHDDNLKRTCNDNRRVDELTLKELQDLTLFNTNHKIPTLKQFLKLVNGLVPILVEYKADLPGYNCSDFCERANKILKDYNGIYAIESFNYLVLKWYKKNMPDIFRGQLSMGMQCYPVALGKEETKRLPMKNRRMVTYLLCNFLGRPNFISYRWQDIKFVAKLNKLLGAKLYCWTVNDLSDSERLLSEYDGIIFEKYLA